MTPSPRHQVLRQVLELHTSSEAQASELHRELSREFAARLAPLLDDVMSSACPEDVTLRIERVELDVSADSVESLYGAISSALNDELAPRLREWVARAPSEAGPGVRRLDTDEAHFERLVHFLRSGAIPARGDRVTREELEAELVRALGSRTATLKLMLSNLPPFETARRLARQFTRATRLALAAVLFDVERDALASFIADWRALLSDLRSGSDIESALPATGSAAETWLLERIFSAALEPFAPSYGNEAALFEALDGRLQAELGGSARVELVEASIRALAPERPLRRRLALRAASAHRWSASRAATPSDRLSEPYRKGRLTRGKQRLASPREATDTGPLNAGPPSGAPAREARAPRGEQAAHSTTSNAVTPETARANAHATTRGDGDARSPLDLLHEEPRGEPSRGKTAPPHPELARAQASTPAALPKGELLWAGHAGLVLLWPFLRDFFTTLGLVSEGNFVSESARERAVTLAAHLVDGAEEWGEHELLLEKLLCGYPAFGAVTTRIDMTARERTEAGALLGAVVEHWSALGKTSVAGVRTAFLAREGWLSEREAGYQLEIPRVGYDVLLDKLPWSFGVVSLPWMERPIFVEW